MFRTGLPQQVEVHERGARFCAVSTPEAPRPHELRLCSKAAERRQPELRRRDHYARRRRPVFSSDLSAFFLPGLVHQFGNILLTVQGNVAHARPDNLDEMQAAVTGAVHRGSASLDILRALLGDESDQAASAQTLLDELAELARIPLRERGLTLKVAQAEEGPVWVYGATFVAVCAHALQSWVTTLPATSEGLVHVRTKTAADGRHAVSFSFEPAPGNLPFPLMAEQVAAKLGQRVRDAGESVYVEVKQGGIELRFATIGPRLTGEA